MEATEFTRLELGAESELKIEISNVPSFKSGVINFLPSAPLTVW